MRVLVPLVLVLVLVGVPPSRAIPHDGHGLGPEFVAFSVAGNGEFKLGEDVRCGSVLLKKGTYRFAHQVDGEDHVLALTPVNAKDGNTEPYEVRTRLVSEPRAASKTVLVAREMVTGALEIAFVQVAGEAGDHLPDGAPTR